MKLCWGVLGCANIAIRSVIPAILSVPENSVAAIASRERETAERAAQPFGAAPVEGYAALLERDDVDAVYIPLPASLHAKWVIAALRAGKHVLVEKPAATTAAEAEEMVSIARASGLALVENFQFIHHSQNSAVKKMLADGVIGELRALRTQFGFPPFDAATNIRYKRELGGGALLDAGAYTLRASSFLLGEGLEVKAAHLAHNAEYDVDWYGGAFLASPTSPAFSETAFGFDNYYQCGFEIWGSTGRILSNRAYTAKADFSPTIILERDGKVEAKILPPDDHFHNAIQHFNRLVEEGSHERSWEDVLTQARLVQGVRDLAGWGIKTGAA